MLYVKIVGAIILAALLVYAAIAFSKWLNTARKISGLQELDKLLDSSSMKVLNSSNEICDNVGNTLIAPNLKGWSCPPASRVVKVILSDGNNLWVAVHKKTWHAMGAWQQKEALNSFIKRKYKSKKIKVVSYTTLSK